MNDETTQTTLKHSLSCELYFDFILLLDWLVYATTNFQPSLLSWINTIPNPKLFQLMCNLKVVFIWGGHKMGVEMN